MAMGDWQNTDTMYGEGGGEYWAHSWLPTPRYPLAPLNRLADPYWFERKHYADRPYPQTGDFFESNTPWGMILNPTVGQIIKPNLPMHREDLAKINEEIKESATRQDRLYGVVTASGAMTLKSPIQGPAGDYLIGPGGNGEGSGTGSGSGSGTGTGGGNSETISASGGGSGTGTGFNLAVSDLTSMNANLKGGGPVIPKGSQWVGASFTDHTSDMFMAKMS
jgi:hypothetical protein